MLNPHIFRAYDIRGIYGTDFDSSFTQRLGSKVAAYLKGTVIVGRDGRQSSEDLAYAAIDGAMHVGAQVIDVGYVSSPQLYWAVRELGAAGGMMVTASHNAGDYNGVKVVARRGSLLDIVDGHHLRQIYDSHGHTHRSEGSVAVRDIISGYAAAVADAAGWDHEELQLSLDAPTPVRQALEAITSIAPDHGLAAKFDSDGDRITFFDNGRVIAADWIFSVLAGSLAGESAVFDLRFSRAVREHLDRHSISYTVSPVGRPSLVKAMQETGAGLGAETSGHYYWKSFAGMESPELTLLRVMQIIRKKSQTIGELVAPYIHYAKSEEINIPVKDRKSVVSTLERIAWYFGDGRTSRMDGLTVEYQDWWFNIRPSNTEPLLRLVVEAASKEMLDQKVEQVLKVIR
jgi:phosphomannomutase